MNIQIPRRPLYGMLHLAAVKDARAYLRGVYVEASPLETRLTATDGAIMGTYRHVIAKGEPRNDCGTSWCGILTRETVARLGKPTRGDADCCVLSDASGALRIDDGAIAELHDAHYPDYRRLYEALPKVQGEPGQFNPELLMLFVKFGRDGLESKHGRPAIRHDGPQNVALVSFPTIPEFVGAIMPLRVSTAAVLPAWATLPVDQTPAKLAA